MVIVGVVMTGCSKGSTNKPVKVKPFVQSEPKTITLEGVTLPKGMGFDGEEYNEIAKAYSGKDIQPLIDGVKNKNNTIQQRFALILGLAQLPQANEKQVEILYNNHINDPMLVSELTLAGRVLFQREQYVFLEYCEKFEKMPDYVQAFLTALTKAAGLTPSEDLECNKVFAKLNEMNSIAINRCPDCTKIPPKIFDGLDNLTFLEISESGLSEVPPNAFFGLKILTTLSLLINKTNAISKDAFSGLTNLNNLSLFEPNLTQLPDGLFSHTKKLARITMHRKLKDQINNESERLGLKLDGLESRFTSEIILEAEE